MNINAKIELFLISLVYSAIVIAVLYFSTSETNKRIYDKYLISLETTEFSVNDLTVSEKFYTEILDFDSSKDKTKDSTTVTIKLPERRMISIDLTEDHNSVFKSNVMFRVRNGFTNLHRELKKRFEKNIGNFPGASLSEIRNDKGTLFFFVKDPDGNTLLFRKKKFLRK